MASDPRADNRSNWWLLLFVIPFVALLFPQLYNFSEPTFIGIPFYYWYQLLWVILSAALTWLVYVKVR